MPSIGASHDFLSRPLVAIEEVTCYFCMCSGASSQKVSAQSNVGKIHLNCWRSLQTFTCHFLKLCLSGQIDLNRLERPRYYVCVQEIYTEIIQLSQR